MRDSSPSNCPYNHPPQPTPVVAALTLSSVSRPCCLTYAQHTLLINCVFCPTMLPCEHIKVSLGAFHSPQQHPASPGPDPQSTKDDGIAASAVTARVLHLEHYGQYSFVEVGYLATLHAKKHGPGVPMPAVDNDTRVTLRWHYPSLDTVEETTHRVLRDITYPVILRKDDWIAPIMRLLSQERRRRPAGGCPVLEEGDDEMDLHAASESDRTSSRGDMSSPASPPSTVDDDWKSCCGSSYTATPRRSEIELVDSAYRDTPKDQAKQHYWEWSQKEQRWFHRNPNGSTIPFPELD